MFLWCQTEDGVVSYVWKLMTKGPFQALFGLIYLCGFQTNLKCDKLTIMDSTKSQKLALPFCHVNLTPPPFKSKMCYIYLLLSENLMTLFLFVWSCVDMIILNRDSECSISSTTNLPRKNQCLLCSLKWEKQFS